jgi:hypothetical protein
MDIINYNIGDYLIDSLFWAELGFKIKGRGLRDQNEEVQDGKPAPLPAGKKLPAAHPPGASIRKDA